jgi:hypothetical protein
VAEFIPLIMNTISLQPPQHLRQSPAFNKEVFVDFMGAQIKTLSFLAYIIRYEVLYQSVLSIRNYLFWMFRIRPKYSLFHNANDFKGLFNDILKHPFKKNVRLMYFKETVSQDYRPSVFFH